MAFLTLPPKREAIRLRDMTSGKPRCKRTSRLRTRRPALPMRRPFRPSGPLRLEPVIRHRTDVQRVERRGLVDRHALPVAG